MKKKILLFTAVAALGSLAISSYHGGPARNGFDCTGAEAAGTGSFVNSNGCYYTGSGCHNTSATTSIVVAIELDSAGVPTTNYKPGNSYTVKLTGTATGTANTHYGFQLNALKGTASASTNADAGTWTTTGLPTGTQVTAPGSYTQLTCVEQSNTQTLSGSSFTKSFTWTAPVAGTGAISFWAAANFVNNDGNANAADVWNTNHVVINELVSTTAVSSVANNLSISAFPNPVMNNLSLHINNAVPGTYSVQVVDMSGRTITTETVSFDGANHSSNINTSNWLPGTYQVVVERNGDRQVLPVIKL